MIMRGALFSLTLAAGCCLQSGCAGISGPDWYQQDSLAVQRAKAELWDPYPDKNAGPHDPAARPPGFANPLPEADRRRWPFPPRVSPTAGIPML